MSAIEFVVRDGAGGLNRGFVGGEGASAPLMAGPGSDISLNLNQGQILGYARNGTSLEITLVDGQVIVIDGFFGLDGRPASDLYISTSGAMSEVNLIEGAEGALFGTYVEADVYGKWGPDEDLYFLNEGTILLAGDPDGAEPQTGMLTTGFLATAPIVPALLAGSAAVAAGTVLDDSDVRDDDDDTTDDGGDGGDDGGDGGDGDGDGDDGGGDIEGAIVEGTVNAGHIVNAEDYADGVEISGTGTVGADIKVDIDGETQTTTVDADGNWSVTFTTDQVDPGTYETDVTVTVCYGDQELVLEDTVQLDTEVNVDLDMPVTADNIVNAAEAAGGVTLTGTAEAGATVVVNAGGLEATTTADADGNWSVTYDSTLVPGGEYGVDVTVTATDAVGNTATTTGTFSVDTVTHLTLDGPVTADNVINAAEANAGVTLTGTAQAGATVVVNAGGVVQTTTAGADGTWSVSYDSSDITSGEYGIDVNVTATDAAGNVATTSGTVEIDTYVNQLEITSGPVTPDNVVNEAEHGQPITLSGAVEAGSTVTVTLAGVSVPASVDANGNWSVTFAPGSLPPGEYEADLIVDATDAAGNTATISETVQIDTEISVALDKPIEGNDVINGAEASDGVVLTGTADAGAIVTVTFAGVSRTTVASADGTWSMAYGAATIPPGESFETVSVTATDAAGNSASVSHTVEIDTFVNELTTTDPVEGDNIVNRDEAGDGITLTGTVEEGSTVMVTFEGTTHAATVDAAGNWSVTFGPDEIPPGEYEANVTIAATDAHGNTAEITDTFLVDTAPPEAPLVESYTRAGEGVRAISTSLTDDDVDLFSVAGDGSVSSVAHDQEVDTNFNELSFDFDAPVPNGSHLVINASDTSGNSTATLFVLEETGTNVVDVTNSGLDGFDIEAVDLQFAEDAELTLSASDLEALCAHSNTLTIHGGTDDTVRIEGATATTETSEIGGKTYAHYELGDNGGTLIIDETINVIV